MLQNENFFNNDIQPFTTIYTDFQTAGRGQAGNVWESEKGKNLLASIYLKTNFLPQEQFYITIYFALAVRKMLLKYFDNPKIKWANDIYVRHKKIAGILLENRILGNTIDYSIAGIGLNINQEQFSSKLPNPTSIFLETKKKAEPIVLLKELLNELAANLSYNKKQMLQEYYAHLYRMEEWGNYFYQEQEIQAKITGIDKYGRLCLQERSGKMLVCGFKEIVFL